MASSAHGMLVEYRVLHYNNNKKKLHLEKTSEGWGLQCCDPIKNWVWEESLRLKDALMEIRSIALQANWHPWQLTSCLLLERKHAVGVPRLTLTPAISPCCAAGWAAQPAVCWSCRPLAPWALQSLHAAPSHPLQHKAAPEVSWGSPGHLLC